jgi:hypothetical protein
VVAVSLRPMLDTFETGDLVVGDAF